MKETTVVMRLLGMKNSGRRHGWQVTDEVISNYEIAISAKGGTWQ